MSKLNCWEFMNCERHDGGSHVSDLGICPATKEMRLDGVHGGSNAGRSCWLFQELFAREKCKDHLQGNSTIARHAIFTRP